MKRLLTLFGTIIAIVAIIGCEGETTLTAPTVDYEADADGAELALTITENPDADGYIIYGDDAVLDTVTTLTYNVTTPVKLVEVTAYAGEDESDATQIDCAPVITTSLTLYGNSDPAADHPSGMGFNSSGTAVAIPLSDSSSWPSLDFYLNDANPNIGPVDLTSPNVHTPVYNDKFNGSIENGTDFDALDITDELNAGYSDQTGLAENAVYSLWIDPDAAGYTADDHFGKMQVESITGSAAPYTLVLTFAYQPILGLRWVVTP